jgi:hypothetical protein
MAKAKAMAMAMAMAKAIAKAMAKARTKARVNVLVEAPWHSKPSTEARLCQTVHGKRGWYDHGEPAWIQLVTL